MGYGEYNFRWAPYVPVRRRLAMARKRAAKIAKKQKREPSPVAISGRKIATTFWGKAWCDNLQAYSDFSNRLPRGATYVRNGSVVDLIIDKGTIEAIVAGSEPYSVTIRISPLAKATWQKIIKDCSASIESLIDLLGGRLSDGVMRRLTEKEGGCFPQPSEIKMSCSCPDYSDCCKHIAAVMYGVGNRLDTCPELLFTLRGVDHFKLVRKAVSKANLERELPSNATEELSGQDLGELFGIELDVTESPRKRSARSPRRQSPKSSRTSSMIATDEKRADEIQATDPKSTTKPKVSSEGAPKGAKSSTKAIKSTTRKKATSVVKSAK